MTRQECEALFESWAKGSTIPNMQQLIDALGATLEREKALLSNGDRLFDMARVRNLALEEAAVFAHDFNGPGTWIAQDLREQLKTPPDPPEKQ